MPPARASWRHLPLALAAISLAIGLGGIVWTFPRGVLTTAFEPPVRLAAPLEAMSAPRVAVSPAPALAEAAPAPVERSADAAPPTTGQSNEAGYAFPTADTAPAPPDSPAAAGTPVAPSPTPGIEPTPPPRTIPTATPVGVVAAAQPGFVVEAQVPAPPSRTAPPSTPTTTPTPSVSAPAAATPDARPGKSGAAPGHNKTPAPQPAETKKKKK
jgi:hypothetical protein